MTDTGKIIRHINHDGIKRQRRRLHAFRNKLNAGSIDLEHIEMSLQSYLSQCDRADTWHTKQNMVNRFHRMFPESKAFYPEPKFDPAEFDRVNAFVTRWWQDHQRKRWSILHMKRAYARYKEALTK